MKRQLEVESITPMRRKSEEEVAGINIEQESSSTRLGQCEVCASTEARYSCPKCEVKTCSLRCVQLHKKELSCDGIRDRTKFIPLRKMTKMDFMSDYYFLEECTRFAADRKSDCIKSFTRYNKILPTHLFRLRNAAAERRTMLRFLLQNFSRHKENTTYYNWKQKKIFWRVEWIFANACGLKYVDERCAEDVPLEQLLDKYINPENVEEVPQKKSLEYYQSVGVFGLKLLLKAEGIKRSRSRFYSLDATQTLKQNLAGKTLVEFPCIYVSYETDPVGFDIIDSDEDVETEAKSYEKSLNEQSKKQWLETKAKREGKSLDDESDEEESEQLKKSLNEKRQEERRLKRQEFEKAPNNFLFADEKLWEILSSSESENDGDGGNETEEETDQKT